MCLKVEIVVITFQVLFLVTTFCRQDDHYFESDFDPNQNCKNKTLIDKLEKMILPNSKHETPERCVTTSGVFTQFGLLFKEVSTSRLRRCLLGAV